MKPTPETLPVIVINEALAQRYWPNEDPIGRRMKAARPNETISWLTVVGVVRNFRDFDVASQPQPTIFFPSSQSLEGAWFAAGLGCAHGRGSAGGRRWSSTSYLESQ